MGQRPGRERPCCIKVMLSPEEYEAIKAVCDSNNVAMSAWARKILTAVAESANSEPITVEKQKRGYVVHIT